MVNHNKQTYIDIAVKELESMRDDAKFYMVTLNLSGRRDELEAKAADLIDKHGILKALQLSRGKIS